jgi:hypothetical protein
MLKYVSTLCGVAGLLALVYQVAQAAPPKVEKQDGHVNSLVVELTYETGVTQEGILFGFGNRYNYHTHILRGYSADNSQVDIWLDTIASIEEIDGDEAVLVLKDETRRTVRFEEDKNLFYFATPDGNEERIAVSQIKNIKFLATPRKDRDDNAMFPQWKFSPFTGEKLKQL